LEALCAGAAGGINGKKVEERKNHDEGFRGGLRKGKLQKKWEDQGYIPGCDKPARATWGQSDEKKTKKKRGASGARGKMDDGMTLA